MRLNKCPSINLIYKGLIVEHSSSSQSGDFYQLSQGNSAEKLKSQIWSTASNLFNSSNSWSVPSNNDLLTQEQRNKRKKAIKNWPPHITSKIKTNSEEKDNNLITQSNKKGKKNVHEMRNIAGAIPISTRLETVFSQCRKVPPDS